MVEQLFKDVFDEQLSKNAIINDRHTGHKEDYLLLDCLLRKHHPKTFFEIGTNTGFGTTIIKNALGNDSTVYSLDLPDEEWYKSKQHPISEGKIGVGCECEMPYVQLRGDSLVFDFNKYPCEGYFVDGEHKYKNVFAETDKIVQNNPKIIVWHDTDEPEVLRGVIDAMRNKPYELYRVIDTRITYALKKNI